LRHGHPANDDGALSRVHREAEAAVTLGSIFIFVAGAAGERIVPTDLRTFRDGLNTSPKRRNSVRDEIVGVEKIKS
jgi:hypothetical protein